MNFYLFHFISFHFISGTFYFFSVKGRRSRARGKHSRYIPVQRRVLPHPSRVQGSRSHDRDEDQMYGQMFDAGRLEEVRVRDSFSVSYVHGGAW